jgi:hypothetical protein
VQRCLSALGYGLPPWPKKEVPRHFWMTRATEERVAEAGIDRCIARYILQTSHPCSRKSSPSFYTYVATYCISSLSYIADQPHQTTTLHLTNTTMVGKKQPVYVLGVGMTKFIKPRGKVDYPELGFEAGVKAMLDAHINYDDVDQGVACYCYGDSTCGQRVFYQFGMTGIPVYNVNNNCSTGSTGLYMGRNMIAHGAADCVLVVGFEKMFPGSLQSFFQDRSNPTSTTNLMMKETRGVTNSPGAAQLFGNAGREHMEK